FPESVRSGMPHGVQPLQRTPRRHVTYKSDPLSAATRHRRHPKLPPGAASTQGSRHLEGADQVEAVGNVAVDVLEVAAGALGVAVFEELAKQGAEGGVLVRRVDGRPPRVVALLRADAVPA